MSTLTYAGIGSRQTPSDVLRRMTRYALRLQELGWVLRSGGAAGADTAFEMGAGAQKEIFLPWENFGIAPRPGQAPPALTSPSQDAMRMAAKVHPNWAACSRGARALHARSCHQVLGQYLNDPVKFVLCWTPDGAQTEHQCTRATGGTATAIRLADRNQIPSST
jgi:hypothetical protein